MADATKASKDLGAHIKEQWRLVVDSNEGYDPNDDDYDEDYEYDYGFGDLNEEMEACSGPLSQCCGVIEVYSGGRHWWDAYSDLVNHTCRALYYRGRAIVTTTDEQPEAEASLRAIGYKPSSFKSRNRNGTGRMITLWDISFERFTKKWGLSA